MTIKLSSNLYYYMLTNLMIFFAEKFGCSPEEASKLVKFINDSCPNLHVIGLMTIGALGYDTAKGPNPDFLVKIILIFNKITK